MISLTRPPKADREATASRSMSPVDSCGMANTSAIRVACVPFPAPGGPNRTSLINHTPRVAVLAIPDQVIDHGRIGERRRIAKRTEFILRDLPQNSSHDLSGTGLW